jgi:hypothetical protein
MYKLLNLMKLLITELYFEINFHLVAFHSWTTCDLQAGQIVPVCWLWATADIEINGSYSSCNVGFLARTC